MPVAAKFSEALYDRLGHAVADELVDWPVLSAAKGSNRMDATYRSDLRELNELNFARFDAKLEQRLAEVRAELRTGLAELRAELLLRIDTGLAELRGELRGGLSALEARLERRFGEQSRWLVGIWITVIAAAVALWLRR